MMFGSKQKRGSKINKNKASIYYDREADITDTKDSFRSRRKSKTFVEKDVLKNRLAQQVQEHGPKHILNPCIESKEEINFNQEGDENPMNMMFSQKSIHMAQGESDKAKFYIAILCQKFAWCENKNYAFENSQL
jgi:hypothetical protein